MKIGHFELVTCTAVQPNTGAAAAAASGDSLTIKNGRKPIILTAWGLNQVAGWVGIMSPSAHDTTRGYRARVVASQADLILPLGVGIEVEPQELLSVTIAGSNTAGDMEQCMMLIGYDELPGSDQQKLTWGQFTSRLEKLVSVDVSITAVASVYTEELITADSDLLKANRQYAVLGAKTSIECGAITLRGPDTANVKVGVPGNELDGDLTAGFFGLLARSFDAALIPVINSSNKAATYIGAHADENGATVLVSLILGLLK